ncbi:glycosyltransferase family 24 protein [Sistotremastrum suecicum HHB10207 ss-3]|uniref:Glycosyltransferase family 24 protein n=1 Tax=Sistotremastrum suecicum HHB10207 ss-3 TaxID=1314776 RepID=A0A166C2T0_9AGAM|nr:glycosyltransferase family 24 protein [Sistotremastrum suecicum HHB10207 ss-3]
MRSPKGSILYGLSAFFCLGTRCLAQSSPIKIQLRATWPAPPLLLDILETVSLEQPESYFRLLDVLTSPEHGLPFLASSNEGLYQAALQLAEDHGFFSAAGARGIAERALALHVSSPLIEAFFSHYIDQTALPIPEGFSAEDCESWVDWYGRRVCDVEALKHLAGVEAIGSSSTARSDASAANIVKLLPFDHVNPPEPGKSSTPHRRAILYASLTSTNFRPLHEYLYTLSSDPASHVQYIVRYVPVKSSQSAPLYLTGYGTSLDLKKTEYLAQDDRRTWKQDATGDSQDAVEEEEVDQIEELLLQYPIWEGLNLTAPIEPDETPQLGLQAMQFILNTSKPLSTLQSLSQNFPKYTTSLARRVNISDPMADEYMSNAAKAPPGLNIIWLNGVALQETDVDPFNLLRVLRKERHVVESLSALGIPPHEAIDVLTHPSLSVAQGSSGILDGLFDASDRPEGGDVIIWWNNLETDTRYSKWTPSLSGILRPLYPGQFHQVARNIYNSILVLDLSKKDNLEFIGGPISNIIARGFPYRFGVVPSVETEAGVKAARFFYYLIDTYGRQRTMEVIKKLVTLEDDQPSINFVAARALYDEIVDTHVPEFDTTPLSFDVILSGADDPRKEGTSVQERIKRAGAYSERLGTVETPDLSGHAFVNGKYMPFDGQFIQNMQIETQGHLQHFQEGLFSGRLKDSELTDISVYFYDLPTTPTRRNKYIYPADNDALRIVNLLDTLPQVGLPTYFDFVYPEGENAVSSTLWVIGDMDSTIGVDLLIEALTALRSEATFRLSVIHIPAPLSDTNSESSTRISALIHRLQKEKILSKISPVTLSKAIQALRDTADHSAPHAQQVLSNISPFFGAISTDSHSDESYWEVVEKNILLSNIIDFPEGQNGLLLNGRIVGPIERGGFASADFDALLNYETHKRITPAVEAVKNLTIAADLDRSAYAELATSISSLLAAIHVPDPAAEGILNTPRRVRSRPFLNLDGNLTSFSVGQSENSFYEIVLLLDPLSETGQKWSSILTWLAGIESVFLKVYMNPSQNAEIPIKRFYRYNLPSGIVFNDEGAEEASAISFKNLNPTPIYTLGMDAPISWLVRPIESVHDLDNIHLDALSPVERAAGVQALFQLNYLVIEGHARDLVSRELPSGLQLQLTGKDGGSIADTLVVANLGYFQLKAPRPGVFGLEIREGRSREVYEMESSGNRGFHSPTVNVSGNEIYLTSFEGLTLFPRFTKRPGMEAESALSQTSSTEHKTALSETLGKITSFFKSSTPETADVAIVKPQADINIFTVASGHLYERLASIMILTVMKNTNSTVKFWFIENFLSPSFLQFIPLYAEQYGFEYELVTYKWPSWLRPQKEKQRIIWAYKILFLDVLFPMDLKKVIFVDSDQIIRTDLQELVDLDLHGAPYGFTPMGDDNTDMEGFRFWKTGYWKEFLAGLPYHISALYVVDLVRFRQLAAGDRLRAHYQALSADPNSLSNLDQDLPNNMQREIPIYSLHEDWLWCETWCSMDRFERAKSIDLCFNPLTKESKLTRAKKTPGWLEYDAEIAQFTRSLVEKGQLHGDAVTADTEALARVGNNAAKGAAEEDGVEDKEGKEEGDVQKPEHDEL